MTKKVSIVQEKNHQNAEVFAAVVLSPLLFRGDTGESLNTSALAGYRCRNHKANSTSSPTS